MCVEVDITKSLLSKFRIKGRSKKIEYEGIHIVCFHCGVYKHRKDGWSLFIAKMNMKKHAENVGKDNIQNTKVNEPVAKVVKPVKNLDKTKAFGTWMLVTRRPRKNDKSKASSVSTNTRKKVGKQNRGKINGGTFASLQVERGNVETNEVHGLDEVRVFQFEQSLGLSKPLSCKRCRHTVQIMEKKWKIQKNQLRSLLNPMQTSPCNLRIYLVISLIRLLLLLLIIWWCESQIRVRLLLLKLL